jgi:hypothetical protein
MICSTLLKYLALALLVAMSNAQSGYHSQAECNKLEKGSTYWCYFEASDLGESTNHHREFFESQFEDIS